MTAVVFTCLLGMGVVGAASQNGNAEGVRVGELLDNSSSFDGRSLTLRGTFARLQTHITRKGNRYYTFELVQNERGVLVVIQDRPPCHVGALVHVKGRFNGLNKHLDATEVTCD